MGVEGLWKILNSTKEVVTLESLSGKVLAVDLSIWIYQALRSGASRSRNAHLKILFFRICKLLFYGVKPIFVFDGPNVPYFKQLTLSKRRLRKAQNTLQTSKVHKKVLKKLSLMIAKGKLPEKSPQKSQNIEEKFDLSDREYFSDTDSDGFEVIQPKMQRQDLPEDSNEFCDFQLQNLLVKNQTTKKMSENRQDSIDIVLPKNFLKIKNAFYGVERNHFLLEIKSDQKIGQSTSCERFSDGICESSDLDVHDKDFGKTSPKIDTISYQELVTDQSHDLDKEKSADFTEKVDLPQKIHESPDKSFDRDLSKDSDDEGFDKSDLENQGKVKSDHSNDQDNDETIQKIDHDDRDEKFLIHNRNLTGIERKSIVYDYSDQRTSQSHDIPISIDTMEKIESCDQKLDESSSDDDSFIEVTSDDHKIETVPEKLEGIEEKLEEIQESFDDLKDLKQKLESRDRSVTSEILEECKLLIRMFNLPIVESFGEAEAECARLEQSALCQGVVTDDSDVWLFGAKNVYRHVFDRRHYVERYCRKKIEEKLGLTRGKMIKLAMLTGCDYTEGLKGVGSITALEILSEFSCDDDTTVDDMKEFRSVFSILRSWYDNQKTSKVSRPVNTLRQRLLNLDLKFPDSFPDQSIMNEFLNPKINEDNREMTSFQKLTNQQLARLKKYARENLDFSVEKINELLTPALEKFNQQISGGGQLSMKNFTYRLSNEDDSSILNNSKRLTTALTRLKRTKVDDNPPVEQKKSRRKKK